MFCHVMIIDCFLFYNEVTLLNYRLHALQDVVDYFVVVESTRTFTGNEKPIMLTNRGNIIHVVVDLPYSNPTLKEIWKNEYFQRNAISQGIQRLSLKPSDLIILSDVDEIPDPYTLSKIKRGNIPITINTLEMDFYYYNLTSKIKCKWPLCKILTYEYYIAALKNKKTCNDIRHKPCSVIKKGGWHLSYFGSASFIQNKIKNFSHQELNRSKYVDLVNIETKINEGKDLFDRNIKIEKIEIKDNKYLPVNFSLLCFK